jgi:hypothetical protein
MATTPALRLLPEGRYVAYGSYSLSDSATSRRPLESFFSLSHTELLLVFEGSFSSPGGVKHGFTMELELPRNEVGKGYFVFQCPRVGEIKGVVGTTEGDVYLLAGRSAEPPSQLSAHLVLVDEHNVSLQGLLAFENLKWVTWSVSMKSYDPQKAKSAVMSLPKRA